MRVIPRKGLIQVIQLLGEPSFLKKHHLAGDADLLSHQVRGPFAARLKGPACKHDIGDQLGSTI